MLPGGYKGSSRPEQPVSRAVAGIGYVRVQAVSRASFPNCQLDGHCEGGKSLSSSTSAILMGGRSAWRGAQMQPCSSCVYILNWAGLLF